MHRPPTSRESLPARPPARQESDLAAIERAVRRCATPLDVLIMTFTAVLAAHLVAGILTFFVVRTYLARAIEGVQRDQDLSSPR